MRTFRECVALAAVFCCALGAQAQEVNYSDEIKEWVIEPCMHVMAGR